MQPVQNCTVHVVVKYKNTRRMRLRSKFFEHLAQLLYFKVIISTVQL